MHPTFIITPVFESFSDSQEVTDREAVKRFCQCHVTGTKHKSEYVVPIKQTARLSKMEEDDNLSVGKPMISSSRDRNPAGNQINSYMNGGSLFLA